MPEDCQRLLQVSALLHAAQTCSSESLVPPNIASMTALKYRRCPHPMRCTQRVRVGSDPTRLAPGWNVGCTGKCSTLTMVPPGRWLASSRQACMKDVPLHAFVDVQSAHSCACMQRHGRQHGAPLVRGRSHRSSCCLLATFMLQQYYWSSVDTWLDRPTQVALPCSCESVT